MSTVGIDAANSVATVTSRDGTEIAYESAGDGPPVIFVTGAFNDRSTCAPVAALLADRFQVITYDRRGRGDSGDTAPYEVQREIEDLDALIAMTGGTAAVFGFSSGGVLSLRSAATGSSISRVIVYEPSFAVEGTRPRPPADLSRQLADLIAQDRRGDAVALFQTAGIGLPAEVVAQIRTMPFWPALEATAHTTVYDAAITGDLTIPVDQLASITIPALVINGADTWPWLRTEAPAVAEAIPAAVHVEVPEGADHDIPPAAVANAIADFLAAEGT